VEEKNCKTQVIVLTTTFVNFHTIMVT